MKLYRIVKGVSEIVDYDQSVAEKMLKLNPDRYKTIEDFENNFEENTEENSHNVQVKSFLVFIFQVLQE